MEKKSTYGIVAEVLCIVAIFAAFIMFLVFAGHLVFSTSPKEPAVVIRTDKPIELRPGSSVNQKDSVLRLLISQNRSIQDSLLVMNKKFLEAQGKEKDGDDKMKTYASIVGLILAITGLFGLKSINDIRESSVIAAKNDAKEAAKTVAATVAEKEAATVAKATAEITAQTVAKDTSEQISRQVAERVADSSAERYVKQTMGDYKSDLRDIKSFVEDQNKHMELRFDIFKKELNFTNVGQSESEETPAEPPVEPENNTFSKGVKKS